MLSCSNNVWLILLQKEENMPEIHYSMQYPVTTILPPYIFMYFIHRKLGSTQVLNILPYIISEDLLINPNNLITRSGIEKDTMSIWDKDKRTYTDPNELHNEEAVEGMFTDTGLTSLDLYQDPQAALKNKMGNFDEDDIHKSYTRA